ncbi:MAG: leucine-rich repeat domain-containing protein, partial [Ruminococcus callidus]
GNQLTTLDVSANSNLQTVDCSGNQLTTLDVSANSNLQTVDCSGNQLTTLDVSANSNLQTVDCSGNQLTTLDVSANSNLQTVNCSNNQLTTLNFSQNAKLEEVDCSGNQLTELDVYNALLQKLDCSENALPSLFLSECSALRELDCSQNQLVELDTTGLTLEILETAGNQRAIVPQPERAGAYSYDLNNLPELEQDRITGWENASVKEDAANVLQIPADTEHVAYGYRLDSQQAVPVATFTLTLQPDEACYLQLNEEHFPDAAFRSLVRDSFDTDGNSWLSLAELQAAKILTISADSGITDLTGMEQLC